MQEFQMLIDGEWVRPGARETLAVVTPSTNEPIGAVQVATEDDLDRVARAADRVFATWRKTSPNQRAALLNRAAALLRDRKETIARLLTLEQGKPLNEARDEIDTTAAYTEFYAGEALRITSTMLPHPDDAAISLSSTLHPMGPSLILIPWNFPVAEAAVHVAPALAAGCPVILKPPEEAPGAAIEYARCFVDAGATAGLINVVTGNPAQISERLIADPRVRRVAFTGSTPVGQKLAELAGRHLKPSVFELGGNAPFIIAQDADLAVAGPALLAAKLRNAGQVCIAPNRIFVARQRQDEVAEYLVCAFQELRVGDGLDPETQMGPMANDRRIPQTETLLRTAADAGAEILTGGARIGDTGQFFSPTVVTGATDDSPLFNEEIFGPVASLYAFDDLDEAVARANATNAGLAAYAFTQNVVAARKFGSEIRAGMVGVNTTRIASVSTPFGGIRESGWGRVGGREGILCCLEPRLVSERHV